MLKDREIRNRQLNVAQNDAAIDNGDVIEGPIHHHVVNAENENQNYDAVSARSDDEDNTSENRSNCSTPRPEEIIGYKQIKDFDIKIAILKIQSLFTNEIPMLILETEMTMGVTGSK